ncbi:MAG: hypothetical protein J1E78_00470 [Muribaculaceae bacterium]|nr:hypothetical protein [Muribaculaceae bacterium]
MLFEDKDINDKNDYFDNESNAEPKPKKEKKPTYSREDMEYWEGSESEWDHLKIRMKVPFWIWIVCAGVFVGLIIALWMRFFSPYVVDATQYGYIDNIERRGTMFKTFEGTLIPYKELMDTTRIYNRDFVFSVADDQTATKIKQAMYMHKPVRVGYKKYYATVPWRGASKIIVTDVDTVSPDNILPPEFAPGKK